MIAMVVRKMYGGSLQPGGSLQDVDDQYDAKPDEGEGPEVEVQPQKFCDPPEDDHEPEEQAEDVSRHGHAEAHLPVTPIPAVAPPAQRSPAALTVLEVVLVHLATFGAVNHCRSEEINRAGLINCF